jgi:cell division protein FtsA
MLDPHRNARFSGQAVKDAEPEPTRLLAALDFGASKTVCLIGRASADAVAVAGVGFAKPQTGSDGAPLDFDACARAIRIAVDQAERMAGETISSITAAFGGKGLTSRLAVAEIPLSPGPITPKAVRAALAAALAHGAPAPGRIVLHAVPLGYRIDDGQLLPDPRGGAGRRLTAELTIVTAPAGAVAALIDCVTEAGLRVNRVVASPYAAGLAVLAPEECLMGAAALDFGAANVGVAAFAGGNLVLCECASGGGASLTADIAARIGSTFAAAERVKLMYGGFTDGPPAENPVEIPRLGGDGRLEAATMSRGTIIEAMGPRLEEMLAAAKARLAPVFNREGARPWRVAATGGCAQLSGMRDLAEHMLGRPVRAGRPVGYGALDDGAQAPAFAVAAGLLRYEVLAPAEATVEGPDLTAERLETRPARAPIALNAGMSGAMGKAWTWLKENF